MRFPNDLTLGGVIAQTFENAKKKYGLTVEELSVQIDYSRWMIYKILDLNDPSSLPISKLIPFMKAVQNYDILKFIARHCGFMIFKIPSGIGLKSLAELQQILLDAITTIFGYLQEDLQIEDVKIKIDEAIGALAAAKSACEKKEEKQRNLFEGIKD